ncbi:MAG: hypothetical protein FWC41_12085 [Firmicutes bacterium]|nr:hypothetical protein [Bacillota bacterium]
MSEKDENNKFDKEIFIRNVVRKTILKFSKKKDKNYLILRETNIRNKIKKQDEGENLKK